MLLYYVYVCTISRAYYMCHDNCHFDELAVYVFELNFSLGFAVSLYVCSVRFEI